MDIPAETGRQSRACSQLFLAELWFSCFMSWWYVLLVRVISIIYPWIFEQLVSFGFIPFKNTFCSSILLVNNLLRVPEATKTKQKKNCLRFCKTTSILTRKAAKTSSMGGCKQGRNYRGFGGVEHTAPNVVILQFCRAILTILTKRSAEICQICNWAKNFT
jgi:hypothetical protein